MDEPVDVPEPFMDQGDEVVKPENVESGVATGAVPVVTPEVAEPVEADEDPIWFDLPLDTVAKPFQPQHKAQVSPDYEPWDNIPHYEGAVGLDGSKLNDTLNDFAHTASTPDWWRFSERVYNTLPGIDIMAARAEAEKREADKQNPPTVDLSGGYYMSEERLNQWDATSGKADLTNLWKDIKQEPEPEEEDLLVDLTDEGKEGRSIEVVQIDEPGPETPRRSARLQGKAKPTYTETIDSGELDNLKQTLITSIMSRRG